MRTTGGWIVVGTVLVLLSVIVLRWAKPPENDPAKGDAAAVAGRAPEAAGQERAPERREHAPRGAADRHEQRVNKPLLASVEEFDAAYAQAEAGDWAQARVVARVANECSSILSSYPHKDDVPRVSSLDETTLRAAQRYRQRIVFCHSLDRRKVDRRYVLMWAAARGGDREAVLKLRHYAPFGPDAAQEMPAWKNDVLRLLGQRADDPEALAELADIYALGEIVDPDYARAIAYYEEVLRLARPDSSLHAVAKKWIDVLRDAGERRALVQKYAF